MKKRTTYIIAACVVILIILISAGTHIIIPPVFQMKTLALSQRLIPVMYVHPQARIAAYIRNADSLFALTEKLRTSDPATALESAFRAENGMTLVVSELRRLPDTSIVPYALLFDTFAHQYSFLSGIPKNTPNITQYETINSFVQSNEKTAKTIYYSRLPPQKPMRL